MYKAFYGFDSKPFSIVPNPDCLYMTSKHQLALTYLQYGIAENLGFILLTGDVGTGKTTLVRHILRQIDKEMEVAVIFNTQLSSNQLIEMILSEYELTPEPNNKAKNLDILNDFLIAQYAKQRRVMIIIDEAQNLSREVLEEVRMLSNLQSESQMLLQIMLVGQPELKTKIKSPELSQLTQRIAVNYHLGPLTREETGNYIAYRLTQAGGNPEIFLPEALDKIHEFARGIPRSINLLCDAALLYAFADELQTISCEIIDQVVADKGGIGIRLPGTDQNDNMPESQEINISEGEIRHILPRIIQTEQRVEKLAMQVQWQIQELEQQSASFKDDLIRTLKEQIEQERAKSNATIMQYAKVKETYLTLKREMGILQKKYNVLNPDKAQSLPPEQPTSALSSGKKSHLPQAWHVGITFAGLFVIAIAGIVFFRTC